MNWIEGLREKGFWHGHLALPEGAQDLIRQESYAKLEALLLNHRPLQELISQIPFEKIETMLSRRSGANPEEEDGIWHDDSSRKFAFSWSLNIFGDIRGGALAFRKQGEEMFQTLGPFPPGDILLFLTGQSGFEHRTLKVEKGERFVFVGWCS